MMMTRDVIMIELMLIQVRSSKPEYYYDGVVGLGTCMVRQSTEFREGCKTTESAARVSDLIL